jgi:hypothetical protein
MKYIICILLLSPLSHLVAQKNISGCPLIETFIKGHPYEEKLESSFFTRDFEITVSDSSYKVVSFTITWDSQNGDTAFIHERVYRGNTVKMKKVDNGYEDVIIPPATAITIENVWVKKGNDSCKSAGLAVYLCDAATAEKEKQYIPCVARVQGLGRNASVYSSFFLRDFSLELSDPSYSISSFDIATEDTETGDLTTATIKGNRILIMQPENLRVVSKLGRGSVLTFENIIVNKNGRTYKVRPTVLYIK